MTGRIHPRDRDADTFLAHLIGSAIDCSSDRRRGWRFSFALMPWAGNIYDILATPFCRPFPRHADDRNRCGDAILRAGEGHADAGLHWRPVVLFRPGRSWRPGYTPTRSGSRCRWCWAAPCCSCSAWRSATSSCSARCSISLRNSRRKALPRRRISSNTFSFVMTMFAHGFPG